MQASINGIRLNYQVEGPGSAPTVVLHHPLATNLTVWDELTVALSPRYRVVRFDARGHGDSGRAGAYAWHAHVHDIVSVMRTFDTPVHLVGHSMGGGQAVDAARADIKLSDEKGDCAADLIQKLR